MSDSSVPGRWSDFRKACENLASTHRQLDDFVEKDLFVSKEVKHKILTDTKEKEGQMKRYQMDQDELWVLTVYLIVKRSVGPFFDRSLFLLVSDLNNHAGVDVFPNQLPGFCDVNGDLE